MSKKHFNLFLSILFCAFIGGILVISTILPEGGSVRVDDVVETANHFECIDLVIENNSMRIATGVLNEIVAEAVAMQQPPSDKGKRLKIYYATQAAVRPPTFVVFVNDKKLMHFSYLRYLENRIRETFGFRGTALKFITRERKEG